MGSSYSMGLGVPRENSFAALLPNELSRQARRKVEIYNEGMWGGAPRRAVLNFNDVLAAKPDMILWPLTPWDIEHGSLLGNSTHVKLQDTAGKEIAFTGKVGLGALKIYRKLQDSSAAFLIRHFLYESQSQYLRSYLSGRDDQTGFLKSEPSEEWQSYLRQFDIYFADAEARASAAGVPLVVVLVPNRAMAAMISAREWPASYDPYKLGEELRTIVTRHGGIYIDILPDFRNVPNPEKYYFPVDDHPYPEGHAVISSILAKELTNGTVPSLRAATRPQAASEQGK